MSYIEWAMWAYSFKTNLSQSFIVVKHRGQHSHLEDSYCLSLTKNKPGVWERNFSPVYCKLDNVWYNEINISFLCYSYN